MGANVILDRSGTIVSGAFFEFVVEPDMMLLGELADCPDGVLSRLNPPPDEFRNLEEEWLRAQLVGHWSRREFRECPANPEHVTRVSWENLVVELDGGPHVPDVFEVLGGDAHHSVLVSPAFATALRATAFNGYGLTTVRLSSPPKKAAFKKIEHLQFSGRPCLRPLSIVGHPNLCPWCLSNEIVCQSCGMRFWRCPNCRKWPWVAAKNKKAGDKYLVMSPLASLRPSIIEGHRWDGSDFIYGGLDIGHYAPIVTKRVLEWMLSRHTMSFFARPVNIATEKMNPEQLARLEETTAF
ncbi:MAG: hypothetical protein R3C59_05835 [Planctomycetaceae bacterium]